MLIEHQGKSPKIHTSAFVAPTAVICGEVSVGAKSQIGFGAVVVAEGSPVLIGQGVIIRENALVRATPLYPVCIGDNVLIGPQASLMGCTVADEVFLATGTTVFHEARIGRGAEVRIGGVVHLKSVVPEEATVPIGWVAVGDPARILPPHKHEEIWAIQEPLNFPLTVYGIDRNDQGKVDMAKVTDRLGQIFSQHKYDRVLPER
jgi:carbonic anhydrase/acetyltransferase-like protein (isoleucine patch superfamily)